MMKIILIESTHRDHLNPSLALRGNTLEAYACEILGAYIKQEIPDLDVKIIQQGRDKCEHEPIIWDDEQIIKEVINTSPEIVGFSVLTCNFKRALSIAHRIKNNLNNVKIIFGGQHPSIDAENVAKMNDVDFVVYGEGEVTLKELIIAIKNKTSFETIKGLVYKVDDKIIDNGARSRITNLDDLPFAIRDSDTLLKAKNWNLCYPAPDKQTGVAQMQYSRGCGSNCSFCITPTIWNVKTKPVDNKKITFRSPASIVNEIKTIKEITLQRNGNKINFIYFNDVTFNHDLKQMQKLCEAFINAKLHVPHDNQTEPDENIHWFCLAKIGLSCEDAKLLADAGCSKIGLGIESFDEEIIQKYRKPYKFNQILDTLKYTDEVGIINRVYFVIGSPWETNETLKRNLDGLKKYPIDQIRVAFAVPYPGTPAYSDPQWEVLTENFASYDEDIPIVKCVTQKGLEKELVNRRQELIENFYNSNEYKQRAKNKIERFPFLKHSYIHFNKELKTLSNGRIDIGIYE